MGGDAAKDDWSCKKCVDKRTNQPYLNFSARSSCRLCLVEKSRCFGKHVKTIPAAAETLAAKQVRWANQADKQGCARKSPAGGGGKGGGKGGGEAALQKKLDALQRKYDDAVAKQPVAAKGDAESETELEDRIEALETSLAVLKASGCGEAARKEVQAKLDEVKQQRRRSAATLGSTSKLVRMLEDHTRAKIDKQDKLLEQAAGIGKELDKLGVQLANARKLECELLSKAHAEKSVVVFGDQATAKSEKSAAVYVNLSLLAKGIAGVELEFGDSKLEGLELTEDETKEKEELIQKFRTATKELFVPMLDFFKGRVREEEELANRFVLGKKRRTESSAPAGHPEAPASAAEVVDSVVDATAAADRAGAGVEPDISAAERDAGARAIQELRREVVAKGKVVKAGQ
jgi:hypothetical protein